jgi:serine/threonine-protein kinase
MDNSFFIVQSYIRGYSMPEYVNGYSLSEDLIKKWMIQLGSVIDYLHSIKPSPILHLDIKPGNIIVTPNENIVLVDFGSSIINRKHWNNSKTYSMTYSAPEQILGKPVGSFSDIFSYGKVFDKLLDTAITEGCISQNFYRKYKDIIKTALPLNPELREKNIKKVLNKIKEL